MALHWHYVSTTLHYIGTALVLRWHYITLYWYCIDTAVALHWHCMALHWHCMALHCWWLSLGGKLPPLSGSSLPPITTQHKVSSPSGTVVPKLDLSSTSPRSLHDDDDDDDKDYVEIK